MVEKKILILASTSFIGKNIKKYLENKYTIFSINRHDVDFKNAELLKLSIEKVEPEIIINCCGIVGSSIKNKNYNDFDILNENIILTNNILNSCKSLNIKKIIMFSSYRLFGDDVHENYNEEDIYKSNIKFNIGYLTSKKILDSQIKLFTKDYNIDIVCLIMTNIFGCYDDFSINSRIVPSMITNIKKHNSEKLDIIINSNKNTLVNLVFVDDISRIIEQCFLNDEIKGNIIVFNNNGTTTLEKLTEKISTLFNFKNKIIFNNNDMIISKNIMQPNLTKFNYFFNDFEFTKIDESIKLTIDFVNCL
jgi:GDP-L-fucose synthase